MKLFSDRIAYYVRKGYEHHAGIKTNQYRGARLEAYKREVYARLERGVTEGSRL